MDIKKTLIEESKKEREQQHISCQITGIDFVVTVPYHSHLPQHKRNHYKFHFCQQHPLSRIDEALSFASLSSKEMAEYDETIIAGAILSIFHHWNIRTDHMSAKEANLVLSYGKITTLYSALHFLSSINSRIAKHIPHISLEETNTGTIGTWLWAARSALDLPIDNTTTSKKPEIKKTGILIHSIDSETRTLARELLKALKSYIPVKLYTILSASIPGNTLATMSEALRSNLIKGLEAYIEIEPASSALIEILRKAKNNSSVQERILTTQLDSYENFSDSYQAKSLIVPAKKTLKEILAEKLAKTVEELPKASVQGYENENENSNNESKEVKRIDIVSNLLLDLSDEIDEESKIDNSAINSYNEPAIYSDIPDELNPDSDLLSLEADSTLFDSDMDIMESEENMNIEDEEGEIE